jgi:GNAT superfamily N-acetyltransferase
LEQYRIFRATAESAREKVRALNTLIFPGVPEEGPEVGNDQWLAYDEEGDAVGFACMRPTLDHPHLAFLSRAGVLSSHRGHGLQTRFIRARERYARREEYESVWSYVEPSNIWSANNLIAEGYYLFTPWWAMDGFLYFLKRL